MRTAFGAARPLEQLSGGRDGGLGIGPAGVERKMRDCLDQLVDGQAVVDCSLHVGCHFVGAVEANESGDSDEAAISLGEPRAFPDVCEQHLIGERGQLRAKPPILCCAELNSSGMVVLLLHCWYWMVKASMSVDAPPPHTNAPPAK